MIYNTIKVISPELVGIAIGFLLRHFLMPFISGRETSELLKYLRKAQITRDEQAELKFNLAQTQHWIELHVLSCPYVSKADREAKQEIHKITQGG